MYRTTRLSQERTSHVSALVLVAAFAVTGWLWFIFGSGFLEAKEIDIQGLQSLERGEVLAELDRTLEEKGGPWPRNLLFLNEAELASVLKERLFVEDLVVDKVYPNILRLIIQERQRSVILVSNGQYVNVDASGIVTGEPEGEVLEASQERVAARAFADEIHLPVVVMNFADPLAPGFQVAEPKHVRRWIDVSRAMVAAGMKVRFMKVEAPGSPLARFVSERGYDIYVDLEKPIETQIATYSAFMQTEPDESEIREKLDIRIPGRVFIK